MSASSDEQWSLREICGLVLTYTLGSMTASATSGALLQWSPVLGFPAMLAGVALLGWIALLRTRHRSQI